MKPHDRFIPFACSNTVRLALSSLEELLYLVNGLG